MRTATKRADKKSLMNEISILAVLADRDPCPIPIKTIPSRFQSSRSLRTATQAEANNSREDNISILAVLADRDYDYSFIAE